MLPAGEYIAGGESRTVTILPLIERELRVRARSRAVYWTRFAVASVGCLICLPSLVLYSSTWGVSQSVMGHYAFSGLVNTAFFLCCCAGLLTADSISRERREGTLSLLFLTRLRAFDVLLGNFGSAGITCVCALIAFLPVLMLPVLAGGVTGGEAFRKVLVLFDALFLSLAAGLWASARGRGWFKSGRSALFLLVSLIILPPLIEWTCVEVFEEFSPRHITTMAPPWPSWRFYIDLLSPLSALRYADDISYRTDSTPFWLSLAIVHGLSWFLLIVAGIRLRRAMHEEDGASASPENAALPPRPFTPIADRLDPIAWLLSRQRSIRAVIWTAALVGAIFYGGFRFFTMSFGRFRLGSFAYSFQGLGLAISVVTGSLFAWAASRFFVEARRTGELEILLTTPLGAKTIVSSQWHWLKRRLFWPLVVLVFPTLAQLAVYGIWGNLPTPMRWPIVFSQVLGCVNIIVGVGALFWLGLWHGLKARSQASAIVRTVVLAKGAPYLISLLMSFLSNMLMGPIRFSGSVPFGYWIIWPAPQIANLLFFLWLLGRTRRRLQTELAHGSPVPLALSQSFYHAFRGVGAFVRKARRWPPTPDK